MQDVFCYDNFKISPRSSSPTPDANASFVIQLTLLQFQTFIAHIRSLESIKTMTMVLVSCITSSPFAFTADNIALEFNIIITHEH